jgi:hypothetical protein
VTEDYLARLRAVLESDRDDFAHLLEISGLIPESDFLYSDLSGVDFGDYDPRKLNLDGALIAGAIIKSSPVSDNEAGLTPEGTIGTQGEIPTQNSQINRLLPKIPILFTDLIFRTIAPIRRKGGHYGFNYFEFDNSTRQSQVIFSVDDLTYKECPDWIAGSFARNSDKTSFTLRTTFGFLLTKDKRLFQVRNLPVIEGYNRTIQTRHTGQRSANIVGESIKRLLNKIFSAYDSEEINLKETIARADAELSVQDCGCCIIIMGDQNLEPRAVAALRAEGKTTISTVIIVRESDFQKVVSNFYSSARPDRSPSVLRLRNEIALGLFKRLKRDWENLGHQFVQYEVQDVINCIVDNNTTQTVSRMTEYLKVLHRSNDARFTLET